MGTLIIVDVQKKKPSPLIGQSLKQRRGQDGNLSRRLTLTNLPTRYVGFGKEKRPMPSLREEEEFEYFWETYPETLRERIPWILDLLSNTRGIGWNWAISTIPDLPNYVKEQLGEPVSQTPPRRISTRILPSTGVIISSRLRHIAICYLLFDAIKTIQMTDPYFLFGPSTYELPLFLRHLPPALVFSFRYFLCCTIGFLIPLQMVFAAQDLGACLVGPRILGVMAEPWHLPTSWGSPMDVLDNGLKGFWGSLWHQRLRIFFSAPTAYLIEHGYLTPRSLAAKLAGLFIAFTISGFIHACIAVTQFQPSSPLEMFVFFLLHGVGIIIQTSFCAAFRPWMNRIPKLIRQVGNFLFTFTWFAVTGPLYADNIARGGAWLNEPVPISLFRGLGLGGEGDGWWCWNMYFQGSWYQGKHWWDSGFAL